MWLNAGNLELGVVLRDVRISQGYNIDLLIAVNHLSLVEEDASG